MAVGAPFRALLARETAQLLAEVWPAKPAGLTVATAWMPCPEDGAVLCVHAWGQGYGYQVRFREAQLRTMSWDTVAQRYLRPGLVGLRTYWEESA